MTTPAEEFLKQFPDEELDDELESYLTYEDVGSGKWAMLQHPLVYAVPYFAQMNHWHNNALKQKTKMLEDAWTYEEWTSYVYLHERP